MHSILGPVPEQRVKRFGCARIGRLLVYVSGCWTEANWMMGFPVPKSTIHTFLGTRVYFWVFYRAEQYFAMAGVAVPAGNPFGTKKCVELDFGYRESEDEVCFGHHPGTEIKAYRS